ncbi:hypothetical protein T440DRAFT_467242 [Plenodomus tracheiphilus IPT5]|uniref:Uncharacterized protein n=1 Tax=Plenodomus tracheiphilus IPT5 TaxID=1408161 RepID=A0A6A7BCW8_9PLEO|nr:hypothetical protein T440DRAFT_467242 [Plenodomus tracheiphilus IPT5]
MPYSGYNIVVSIITIALLISHASSSPIPESQPRSLTSHRTHLQHCTTHPENYETISTYDLSWFRTNILSSPSINFTRTLFYTAGMSAQARAYACDKDYTTIWDVWPTALYNSSTTASNPFSCIHNDPASRRIFFKTMSQAYATLAEGTVIVMHNPRHYASSPTSGIWALVERETIVNHADRVKVIAKLRGNDVRSLVAVWIRGLGFGRWPVQKMLDVVPEWMIDLALLRAQHYPRQMRFEKEKLLGRRSLEDGAASAEEGEGRACALVNYEFEDDIDW